MKAEEEEDGEGRFRWRGQRRLLSPAQEQRLEPGLGLVDDLVASAQGQDGFLHLKRKEQAALSVEGHWRADQLQLLGYEVLVDLPMAPSGALAEGDKARGSLHRS